jgi:hypothetical protein
MKYMNPEQNSHVFYLTYTDVYKVLQTVSIDHKFFFSVFVYLSFYCLVSSFSLVVRWQSNYFLRILQCLLQSDVLLVLVGSPAELSMAHIWFTEMTWLQEDLLRLCRWQCRTGSCVSSAHLHVNGISTSIILKSFRVNYSYLLTVSSHILTSSLITSLNFDISKLTYFANLIEKCVARRFLCCAKVVVYLHKPRQCSLIHA